MRGEGIKDLSHRKESKPLPHNKTQVILLWFGLVGLDFLVDRGTIATEIAFRQNGPILVIK